MRNSEIIFINKSVYIAVYDASSYIHNKKLYHIECENTEPYTIGISEDEDRIVVFSNLDIAKAFVADAMANPEEAEAIFDSEPMVVEHHKYNTGTDILCINTNDADGNEFTKFFTNALNEDKECSSYIDENPLFASIVCEICDHINDTNDASIAKTILDIIYTYATTFDSMLYSISSSADQEFIGKMMTDLKNLGYSDPSEDAEDSVEETTEE